VTKRVELVVLHCALSASLAGPHVQVHTGILEVFEALPAQAHLLLFLHACREFVRIAMSVDPKEKMIDKSSGKGRRACV